MLIFILKKLIFLLKSGCVERATSKHRVREEALRERRSMSAERISKLSVMVKRNLEALSEYRRAKTVASYVSKSDEVQTKEILKAALKAGKHVLVPRSHPSSLSLTFHEIHSLGELRPGSFGVLEPRADSRVVSLSKSELVLVPIVAWDAKGRRLGYGKGYFDRALKHKGGAVSVGLAFESQLHSSLPATKLDMPLDMIITEKRTLRF